MSFPLFLFSPTHPARSEILVLQQRVQELTAENKELRVDKAALQAEVEVYRQEAGVPGLSKLALGQDEQEYEAPSLSFTKGTYPNQILAKLERNRPLCVCLADNRVLVTGCADGSVQACLWDTSHVLYTCTLQAPVIGVAHATHTAAGCMDGSVSLVVKGTAHPIVKFAKYVKHVAWLDDERLVVASADGKLCLYKINVSKQLVDGDFVDRVACETVWETFYSGAIEALCIQEQDIFFHVRDTPCIMIVQAENCNSVQRINVNAGQTGAAGFLDHVSFCILSLHCCGDYIVAATDKNRNLVLDRQRVVQNLYGHLNDAFTAHPAAYMTEGYVLGNTTEDGSLCVWDVTKGEIVERLLQHERPIRAMHMHEEYAATVAPDNKVIVWGKQDSMDCM